MSRRRLVSRSHFVTDGTRLDRVIKFPIFLGSQNKINHLDEEFSKLKEDFDRALNVEIYNEIKDNGKYYSSRS